MRNVEEVRDRIFKSLQAALARGSMFGSNVETFQREFLSILAFIDQREKELSQQFENLKTNGTFNACGVRGGFARLTGAWGTDQEIGSVYAVVALALGYLETDCLYSNTELNVLKSRIQNSIETKGYTTKSFFEAFGFPSWPNSNPGFYHPQTYLYLSQEREIDFIACDFYNEASYAPQGGKASGVHGPLPRLRNIRIAQHKFEDQFVFTNFGKRIVEDVLNADSSGKTD